MFTFRVALFASVCIAVIFTWDAYAQDTPAEAEATPVLHLVGSVPLPGEPLQDRIVLFFDAPLAEIPDGVQPFTLNPALEGDFRVDGHYVVFDLAEDSDISGVVEVTLSDQLRGKNGAVVAPEERTHYFATFPWEPTSLWEIEKQAGALTLGLRFPLAVAPDALQSHLQVIDAGSQPVAFSVAALDEAGASYRIRIDGSPALPIEIEVEPGLSDTAGRLSTQDAIAYGYPSTEPLSLVRAEWGIRSEDDNVFMLEFNQPVEADQLPAYVTLANATTSTPIEFSMESGGKNVEQRLVTADTIQATDAITLTIAAGLPGGDLQVLPEAVTRTLQQDHGELQFSHGWWDDKGVDGAALNFRLSADVDVEDLKQHLTVNPPVDGLEVVDGSWRNLELHGAFVPGTSYEIILSPGLASSDGLQTLPQQLVYQTDDVPKVEAVEFSYEGKIYFPQRTGDTLVLASRNVTEATVTIHRLLPGNVAIAVEEVYDSYAGDQFIERWSQQVAEKKIKLPKQENARVETGIDLSELLPKDRKGIYAAAVKYGDQDWYRDTKIVVWTDLGVLAHWQSQELAVFAHDLFTLAPAAAAKVSVYSYKNQLLGTGNTDAEGTAHLTNFDESLGRPSVVVVETADDFTYLSLEPQTSDPTGFTESMPPYDPKAYDAYIYADRDLYRPGETVHLRWIVRHNFGDAVENVPLKLEVVKPNDSRLLTQTVQTSGWGTGELDLETARAYATGKYTVNLYVPSKDQPIGAYTFSLEDFVPNRIETSVKVDQKTWKPGLEYPVQVSAQHLFGAPAADRQAKADVVLRRGEWAPEGWKEYKFGNDAEYTPEIVALGEAETNGQGVADFTFKYAPQANVQFPLSATVIGQVFELGGRGVNARETVTLLPSDILLGIAAEPKDGGAQVHVAAVTPDGTPAALGQVKISLEREYWIYNVRRFSDSNQPWWVKKFTQVATQDVLLSEGRGSATLPISGWGYFRVKVYAPETPVYSTISFYSYWDSIEIVESARPSLIKLTLDKPEYSVGEEVRLRIESPFNGKGIVVLQDEGLQRMLPVQIVDNAAEVRFHVDRNSVPNVWAEVTVVHEVREDAKQVYPFSSFAMVNVPVHDPERKIQVTFPELPEEVRPAQEVSFTLTTADAAGNPVAAEVTLAAVDEGIHGITGYKTPEPYEWLMRPRQPDYRRAHYYDRVAYDFERPAFGGDIEARLGKLAPPVDENWIKPLALWSGVIRTNADGRGTVSFTLPEYNGKLRLVAVAATATAVGADDANVFVRRPYMLRTSMPRFTLPNDQFQARAVIFNTTDQAVKAELSWSAGGTLTGTPGNVTLDVAPKGEASTLADFQATDNIGQGQIDWQVVIRDAQGNEVERLQEQAPLPVRPPAAFQSRHLAARVLPGESQTFQATEFVENDLLETKLHVSANPVWRLKESLDYVVQYPYGCVEQTTSACLPLYLLRSVQELTTSSLTEERRVENYLQAGIRRLFSMQTASGGLSFWPGGTEAYPYGSVYALHFLTLVKNDRELTVPAESFNKLQAYVRREANNWQDKSSDALYRRAYAHYVLALGSDLKAIEQIDRFNDMTIPRAARYLLAAAVATSTGSMDRAKEYLAAQPSEPYTVKLLDGTLNSEIRNQAVELLAKVQMGDLADAEGDVNALLAFLEANRHGNTQESAFIIAALGSYLNKVAGNIDQVGGTVNGPDGSSQLAGMSAFSDVHGGPGGVYTVTNTGQTPLYVNFTTAGMPTQPQVEPYANEIAIERHYYAQEGEELDAAAYSQGAMYVVGLRLDAGQVSRENLVVADLLPAGFEIENPRLEQEALAGMESEEGLTPAHLEIRDDRLVVAFDEVPSGVQWFYYAVRAVTPGAFQQPAVTAECMYDPRIRAASGVREVTVQPRAEQ